MIYFPACICVVVLCASYWLGYTPLIVPVTYVLFSLAALLFYAKDKSAARHGSWRVSEGTLHMLSVLGGWPGAIVAQQKLRHKTQKMSFRIQFWITVIVNSGALAWIHTSAGALYLNTQIFKAEGIVLDYIANDTARVVLLNLLSFHA